MRKVLMPDGTTRVFESAEDAARFIEREESQCSQCGGPLTAINSGEWTNGKCIACHNTAGKI